MKMDGAVTCLLPLAAARGDIDAADVGDEPIG